MNHRFGAMLMFPTPCYVSHAHAVRLSHPHSTAMGTPFVEPASKARPLALGDSCIERMLPPKVDDEKYNCRTRPSKNRERYARTPKIGSIIPPKMLQLNGAALIFDCHQIIKVWVNYFIVNGLIDGYPEHLAKGLAKKFMLSVLTALSDLGLHMNIKHVYLVAGLVLQSDMVSDTMYAAVINHVKSASFVLGFQFYSGTPKNDTMYTLKELVMKTHNAHVIVVGNSKAVIPWLALAATADTPSCLSYNMYLKSVWTPHDVAIEFDIKFDQIPDFLLFAACPEIGEAKALDLVRNGIPATLETVGENAVNQFTRTIVDGIDPAWENSVVVGKCLNNDAMYWVAVATEGEVSIKFEHHLMYRAQTALLSWTQDVAESLSERVNRTNNVV